MRICLFCGKDVADPNCPKHPQLTVDRTWLTRAHGVRRDDLVGRVVGDRFEITAKVAAGGMGWVFRALDRNRDNNVALKILNPVQGCSFDDDMEPVALRRAQRFCREMKACAKLQCPHTVSVHDFGMSDDGFLWLAMEFLQGETLSQLLGRGNRATGSRRLDPRLAVQIAHDVCPSLVDAHRKGVVHRDLKPSNIFLLRSPSGKLDVKVIDFGLAKFRAREPEDASLTQEGTLVGTPQYMAPEQIEGGEVDARTDLYALGVVLYEMLVGELPIDAPENYARMLRIVSTPAPPLPERVGDVTLPAELRRLVAQLLEKKPADRPASAADVEKRLRRIQTRSFGASAASRAEQDALNLESEDLTETGPETVTLPREAEVDNRAGRGNPPPGIAGPGPAAPVHGSPAPAPPRRPEIKEQLSPQSGVGQPAARPDQPQPQAATTAGQGARAGRAAETVGLPPARPDAPGPVSEPSMVSASAASGSGIPRSSFVEALAATRRRRAVTGAVLAGLLVLALAVFVAAWLTGDPSQSTRGPASGPLAEDENDAATAPQEGAVGAWAGAAGPPNTDRCGAPPGVAPELGEVGDRAPDGPPDVVAPPPSDAGEVSPGGAAGRGDEAEPAAVQLFSEPSGARVEAAGRTLGHTPLVVPVPRGGTRRVVLRHRGFQRKIIEIDAASGPKQTVRLTPASPRTRDPAAGGAPARSTPSNPVSGAPSKPAPSAAPSPANRDDSDYEPIYDLQNGK